jgi:Zn-dependent M28 family amino/carboxypeptidase
MNVRIRVVAFCMTAAFVATGCASIPIPFSGLADKLGGLFSGGGSGAKSAQQKSAQKSAQEAAQKSSQKSLEKAAQKSAQKSKEFQKKSQQKKHSGGTPKSLNLSKKPKQPKVKFKHYHDVQGVTVR